MKAVAPSFKHFFDRAAAPLLVAGAAVLSGCSITPKTELNLGNCYYKDTLSTTVGIKDKNIEKKDADGNTTNVKVTGFNFQFEREKVYNAGEACQASKGIVSAGVIKDENGDYNLAGLAVIYSIHTNKDIDPTLRYMITQRIKVNYGFTPDEIPAISKAQWEKNNPPKPETFKCSHEEGIRRCTSLEPATAPQ